MVLESLTNEYLVWFLRIEAAWPAKGITVSGGVIDAGYRGELVVMLNKSGMSDYKINAGEKIVQMIPTEVLTNTEIKVVEDLPPSNRQERGFGSTGQ